MTSPNRFSNRLVPAAGAATLAATAVAGWAPAVPAASAQTADDAPAVAAGTRALDGTYESCSAYFGFGKDEGVAMDVVDFDVSDNVTDGSSDGVTHDVASDTHIVLVLTNDEGDTLECLPEEITEEQWDDEMNYIADDFGADVVLPAWPGPGRFAYPSLAAEPWILDFGEVASVQFRVAGVPEGHVLVSPDSNVDLVQHFTFAPWTYQSLEQDPRLLDSVEDALGAQARADLVAAYDACDEDLDAELDPAPIDAMNHLIGIAGYDWDAADEPEWICYDLRYLTPEVSYILAVHATAAYQEPIVLGLPVEETTTTTTAAETTTTATAATDGAAAATGATPIQGTATYAG